MPMTIWKFSLPYGAVPARTIMIPRGAIMLDVQMQNGQPQVWALVEPHRPPVERRLLIYGTGHEVPDYLTKTMHVGTFQDGGYVFHVFDGGEVTT